ncbi:MAG: prolyl hydroxylase family protein [Gammaproteobacteria bacterium]
MNRLFRKIRKTVHWVADRKGYWKARLLGPDVPLYPIAFLPNGFKINHGGETGLCIVDNFCTPEEAAYLIDAAHDKLLDSRITIGNRRIKDDYRTSQTALVFDPINKDPQVLPLLYRASMLLGVAHTNVESVYVTRYQEGEYYKAHQDFYKGFDGDRLYTVLIYLNDLDDNQGGGTVFEKLNIGVKPRLGRAVIWTNTNPDGSHHEETSHEALPVENGGEKWAIQLWFRKYEMIGIPDSMVETPQTLTGQPLKGDENMPPGSWAPGEPEPGSPYHKAFN